MTTIQCSHDILVIGAGITGLLAARTLQAHGQTVIVLDKGRGVGGRMATRRIGSAVFDYGAQFFTARDQEFNALVDVWRAGDVALEWCRGFAGPDGVAHTDGHPRYRGSTGMTAVPKYLARGLEIVLGQRVTSAEALIDRWRVRTEQGETFFADSLLLTAPVPQSLAILDAGATALPAEIRYALDAVSYHPCIALMIQPETSRLPSPGAIQFSEGPIAWIGDNVQKGVSPHAAITLHADAKFSRDNWNSDDAKIISEIHSAASAWVKEPVSDVQIRRWRYAKPEILHPEACLSLEAPLPLVFAGDAFGTPRVEGAALSGLAAARALLGRV